MTIVFASNMPPATIAGRVRRGELVRLAAGVYTSDVTSDPGAVTAREWPAITGGLFPGAVITDRSAVTGGLVDGVLYLARDGRAQRCRVAGPAGDGKARHCHTIRTGSACSGTWLTACASQRRRTGQWAIPGTSAMSSCRPSRRTSPTSSREPSPDWTRRSPSSTKANRYPAARMIPMTCLVPTWSLPTWPG